MYGTNVIVLAVLDLRYEDIDNLKSELLKLVLDEEDNSFIVWESGQKRKSGAVRQTSFCRVILRNIINNLSLFLLAIMLLKVNIFSTVDVFLFCHLST